LQASFYRYLEEQKFEDRDALSKRLGAIQAKKKEVGVGFVGVPLSTRTYAVLVSEVCGT
jgi:hypothetical protein